MYLDLWVCTEEESIPGETSDLDACNVAFLAVAESTLAHMFEDCTVFPAELLCCCKANSFAFVY